MACCWARAVGRVPQAWPVTTPSPSPPATALKMNMTLRELYLADNKLNGLQDSAQLGNLLKFHCSLQILDLRNNPVLDSGGYVVPTRPLLQSPRTHRVASQLLVVLLTQGWPGQPQPSLHGDGADGARLWEPRGLAPTQDDGGGNSSTVPSG